MPTLDEAKDLIWKLGKEKGWGEELGTKIYYAMIELGEAGDIWKHRDDEEYLTSIGLSLEDVTPAIMEELIDALFYILHGMMCLDPGVSADEAFLMKLDKNYKRNRVYADDKI